MFRSSSICAPERTKAADSPADRESFASAFQHAEAPAHGPIFKPIIFNP
jgi:hypothetical protein